MKKLTRPYFKSSKLDRTMLFFLNRFGTLII